MGLWDKRVYNHIHIHFNNYSRIHGNDAVYAG